jgi:mitochondrial fission protein ELM1
MLFGFGSGDEIGLSIPSEFKACMVFSDHHSIGVEEVGLDSRSDTTPQPRVWLLVGEKRGDNAQVVSLARAIGWDYEEKMLFMKPEWREGKPRVRARLDHLDLDRSDTLEPPWPDLVITAGRRLSSVGLFIKQASQGKTRLVLIGKPRRELESIDLAVVGAHYVLAEGPNVARHDLPLMHADPATLARAAEQWRPRLSNMRRPLTALMVGGPTGGLRFDLATARELFDKTIAGVEASSGSLYITTSRRTPIEVVRMLEAQCPRDATLYVFDPDSGPAENPYHGLLALADHFVVTTDSISMMVEVARLGRALSLFALESEVGAIEGALGRLGVLRPLSPHDDPIPAGGAWARTKYRLGRPSHSRDLSAIPRLLVEQGLACWLGEPPLAPAAPYCDDALERVAGRIRGFFDSRESRAEVAARGSSTGAVEGV